jgi:hypothetical protein
MNDKLPGTPPVTDPSFYGTFDQRCALDRWGSAGWTFLHWTEIPRVMAVLKGLLGEVVFIDENGWAWRGPTFSRKRPVPLDKYPPRVRPDT